MQEGHQETDCNEKQSWPDGQFEGRQLRHQVQHAEFAQLTLDAIALVEGRQETFATIISRLYK